MPLVLLPGDARLPLHCNLPAPVSSRLHLPPHTANVLSERLHESLGEKSQSLNSDEAAQLCSTMNSKFTSSLCAPGESVGTLAAQSVGEPSTQVRGPYVYVLGSG